MDNNNNNSKEQLVIAVGVNTYADNLETLKASVYHQDAVARKVKAIEKNKYEYLVSFMDYSSSKPLGLTLQELSELVQADRGAYILYTYLASIYGSKSNDFSNKAIAKALGISPRAVMLQKAKLKKFDIYHEGKAYRSGKATKLVKIAIGFKSTDKAIISEVANSKVKP